jgi:hypothetical protein
MKASFVDADIRHLRPSKDIDYLKEELNTT